MSPNVRPGHWLGSFCQPSCIKYGSGNVIAPSSRWLLKNSRTTTTGYSWLLGCYNQPLFAFCQPVQCACEKMTSRVGKHETSYWSRGKAFSWDMLWDTLCASSGWSTGGGGGGGDTEARTHPKFWDIYSKRPLCSIRGRCWPSATYIICPPPLPPYFLGFATGIYFEELFWN